MKLKKVLENYILTCVIIVLKLHSSTILLKPEESDIDDEESSFSMVASWLQMKKPLVVKGVFCRGVKFEKLGYKKLSHIVGI